MKKHVMVKTIMTLVALSFLLVAVLESNAHARAGGGRSSGSRASRSYSAPASNYSQPSQPRQQMQSAPNSFQQPQQQRGGFLRSMAGGVMGGLLGGMLFSSLGHAGAGVLGGGGGGLIQILLLAGIGYLIYRFIKKRRAEAVAAPVGSRGYDAGTVIPAAYRCESSQPADGEVEQGVVNIRSMDPSFDENRFKDSVMDTFFKVQGAWMHRSLSPVSGELTPEMQRILQEDIDRLLRDRQVNRLENIAVRNVEIAEVWQESGQDYVTTLILANLLDYTTDEAGVTISGSKTDPVKFEEFWTFTRPVGNNSWRLSAIQQK
jgi:predicted lipid-binding transport protein (Tim44 family)